MELNEISKRTETSGQTVHNNDTTPAPKVAIMFHQEETNHNKDNALLFLSLSLVLTHFHPSTCLSLSLPLFASVYVCRSDKYLGAVDEY